MLPSALSVFAILGGVVWAAQAAADSNAVYVKLQPAVVSCCGTTKTITYTRYVCLFAQQ